MLIHINQCGLVVGVNKLCYALGSTASSGTKATIPLSIGLVILALTSALPFLLEV